MSCNKPKSDSPIPFEVEKGRSYRWCGCGDTLTKPLCDKATCTDKCITYRAIVSETILFCGCRRSKEPPFCDGSHIEFILKRKSS